MGNVCFEVTLGYRRLVARVREHAGERGVTISAVVTQALTEFLARARPGARSR
jgi:hypothetical protein